MVFIISLVEADRFRELSNRGLEVATGWIEALLAKVASDGVAPPPLDRSRLSLSLRMGRGLTGSAMDGTGILGEERTGLMFTGSDPLENFLTSEGLSRRLVACWPLIVLLLDSFQLRPCIEALATGVLVIIADAVPLLPAPPPFPFSWWWWWWWPLVGGGAAMPTIPYVNGLLSSRAWYGISLGLTDGCC
jgi:hypothetical protein